jgi:hypothetical protein
MVGIASVLWEKLDYLSVCKTGALLVSFNNNYRCALAIGTMIAKGASYVHACNTKDGGVYKHREKKIHAAACTGVNA